ncbi:MAG TPA: TSUP family transporter [Candidatus Paceibacterota bacterium]
MIHFYEALVFIVYSFLAAIITAGGSLIVSNTLSLGGINLIRATGMTSSFFLLNAAIACYVFRKDIVWSEVKNILPINVLGAFVGAVFLTNISSTLLLALMFVFSIYFIYKKFVISGHTGIRKRPFWQEQLVGLFSGSVMGAALPGGGFLNSYFASKGFTLQQMFGTLNFIIIFIFFVKVSVMLNAHILTPSDFIGVAIAAPFLILTNYLMRRGLISLSKPVSDKLTILAMSIFSVYALVVIIRSIFVV